MGKRDKFSREEKKPRKGAVKSVSPIIAPLPEVEVVHKKGKKEEDIQEE
jgi:hypothetical protein